MVYLNDAVWRGTKTIGKGCPGCEAGCRAVHEGGSCSHKTWCHRFLVFFFVRFRKYIEIGACYLGRYKPSKMKGSWCMGRLWMKLRWPYRMHYGNTSLSCDQSDQAFFILMHSLGINITHKFVCIVYILSYGMAGWVIWSRVSYTCMQRILRFHNSYLFLCLAYNMLYDIEGILLVKKKTLPTYISYSDNCSLLSHQRPIPITKNLTESYLSIRQSYQSR